ncbi:hypothetical protein ASG03_05215 [Rhizobium sp. Leaf341]|nr:hypothetical protein ASG03_05215 [Rhizobium sp. Leaf341]
MQCSPWTMLLGISISVIMKLQMARLIKVRPWGYATAQHDVHRESDISQPELARVTAEPQDCRACGKQVA